ncbi:DUF3226 domain-containing protein [Proteiniborus sp. MB09-C3]|uniref:DUF3226 domain-containing protein n=1 Tax=Proteiniborus sp. MB09-C3 TaxID=3050072 RepID=UPI002556BFFE|nr:DUF3226 domain-containing protein [Proteiniborus sp. MB09-C3]WIV13284.1 hypothetical protein QO263_06125 [Proteiniborus sp. MB09-C3]
MKNIIFCEGKTDAILLSYYLGEVVRWSFNKKLTKNIGLPIRNFENEEVNVYTKGEDELVIWAVGGASNFNFALTNIIEANKAFEKENSYKKLVILTDRDQAEDDREILERFECNLINQEIRVGTLRNNEWSTCSYLNKYDEENEVKVLPIIIPFNKKGGLETFILDAITDFGEEEAYIVNKSKEYINGFDLINYLNNQRLKLKGELAVTLGTMFPQKTFTPIDSMLKDINWEEYRTIQEGFRKLEEI